MTTIPVRRALLSVHDKTGIADFAERLTTSGVELISSGGTASALAEAGLRVTDVAAITGAPEMLGGRVKTLHPSIHGAILADLGEEAHRDDLAARGIAPIELVVTSLYPFEQTVADPAVSDAAAIEQIDIGGPAMIRAAAKNHAWVAVVTSPTQYEAVASAVEHGGTTADQRRRLAADAFQRTAAYDAAIATWIEEEPLPARLPVALERVDTLRYGENPHQDAALYRSGAGGGWWDGAVQLQGKAMSFNNYVDGEAAWRLARDLHDPGVVIVKHTNASGAAVCDTLASAYTKAWDCDPLSSFGGVVAVNRSIDPETAKAMVEPFLEVIIAPGVEAAAADVFSTKENLRVLIVPERERSTREIRMIEGGALVQQADTGGVVARSGRLPDGWRLVAGEPPSAGLVAELEFAWVVAAHTKSNAIVITRDRSAVGVGAGDQSRVGAAERALARAGERSRGAVAASDAFFPFRDGLDTLAAAGVRAVIEPGGSRRDDEVIAAADEHGITLVFSGMRHFKH